MDDVPASELLHLTALITSAHLSHNHVPTDGLDGLIRSIYGSLGGVRGDPPATQKPQPAVPVKKSVFPAHLICLEDGKKVLMLKRHLRNSHGLTPDEYRQRWNLPDSYPMVAPDYAARRSVLAKDHGLGRPRGVAVDEPAEPLVQRVLEGRRGKKTARAGS